MDAPTSDMPQTANLRRQLADIHTWWTETAAGYEDPVPLGAIMLQELGGLAKDLAALSRDIENTLHGAMGEAEVVVDGVGILTRYTTAESEKFESDHLLRKVVETVPAVDEETGERLIAAGSLAALLTALETALPITASLGWRKRGLDALLGKSWRKDHYEKVPGRKAVRFQ